jgi:sortase A
MENRGKRRRVLGTVLMVFGVLVLLGAGVYLVQSEAQGLELRSQLRATEPRVTVRPEAIPAADGTAAVMDGFSAEGDQAGASTPSSSDATQPNDATGAAADQSSVASQANVEAAPASGATATKAPTRRTVVPTLTSAPTQAPKAPATPAVVAQVTGQEPTRLAIPDLQIDTKVVPMGWKVVKTKTGQSAEWQIPKIEAGHHINSAQLGQPGNLVISGHNNIYGKVFMKISQAWDNDTRVKVDNFTDRSDILTGRKIMLYDASGKEYDYVITDFYRLKDTGVSLQQRIANGRFILPTDDTRLTIITCWPPTNNTHRLVVIAVPAQ